MRQLLLLLISIALSACGGGGEGRKEYIPDPDVKYQWYLHGDTSDASIININLPQDQIYTGSGVLVAIVDNGVDLDQEDLAENISYGNFSYLPQEYGFSNSDHGTSVAGIIAGIEGNGIGGRGIAPGAKIISFNAMRVPSTANIADALRRDISRVSISNNSWGDFNGWGEPLHLKADIESSLIDGTTNGRNGLGIVYVFSAGNGALIDSNGIPFDNVNYSGLVNNKYTLPICAVDQFGNKANYSETGATLLVCAPSKGLNQDYGIFTTDVTGELGYNSQSKSNDFIDKNYTTLFGGTSAAAPMVSGIVALLLESNPGLSWRDVRFILAKSARKIDPSHLGWSKNSAGFNINHSYGFGLVDASAAIDLAKSWKNLPTPVTISHEIIVNQAIPDNSNDGLESSISIDNDIKSEFVDIFFNAPDHEKVGDLEIVLISPAGTKSVLSELHNQTLGIFRYADWRFGSLRHLGESAKGVWKLQVKDKRAGNFGTWTSWKMSIHGYQ